MNKIKATKSIPENLKAKVEYWLGRIYGQSSCYGMILNVRDNGVEGSIWNNKLSYEEKKQQIMDIYTDKEACIRECVAEWRSDNPQADCGIMFRFAGSSVAQSAFYMKFGFLPHIAELRQLFGEIFEKDEERIEAINELNK